MSGIPVLGLKLLAFSWIIAKRQLIHDRTTSRTSWEQTYDIIIVGAGTAGCAVAGRLAENQNVKVLLLEAGGAQSAIWTDMPGMEFNISDKAPELQYLYYSEPQINSAQQFPGGRPSEPLGRALGGTSTRNTMIFNRGNRRDYDEWANTYGAVGWSFQEVLPFFKIYENNTDSEIVKRNPEYHGTNGPVQISTLKDPPKFLRLLQNTYKELGLGNTDVNGPEQNGSMFMQQFISAKGVRSSSANAYIDPNPNPKNLHIVTKAQVVKILFNRLTAIGVEFSKNDRSYKVFAEKEVILTAGATNTPKLLMLSGIGINSDLQQFGIPVRLELPVGNNYMNHPQIIIKSKIHNPEYFYGPALLSVDQLSEYFNEGNGRLSGASFLSVYFSTDNGTDWPNQLMHSRLENDQIIMILNTVRFRSRGTVRLYSSNPYIQPKLDPALLADPFDFQQMTKAMKFVFYILEKSWIASHLTPPSYESIGCPVCPDKPRYECTEWIRCYIRYNTESSYHPSGSCRMGDVQRTDVVVDPRLRVKNVNQLRICDASVFPLLPNSNTNAPIHMVAEKCAHLIKQDYNL